MYFRTMPLDLWRVWRMMRCSGMCSWPPASPVAAADPAAARLIEIALNPRTKTQHALFAIRDLLNRATRPLTFSRYRGRDWLPECTSERKAGGLMFPKGLRHSEKKPRSRQCVSIPSVRSGVGVDELLAVPGGVVVALVGTG
jgi:hypothetical protein